MISSGGLQGQVMMVCRFITSSQPSTSDIIRCFVVIKMKADINYNCFTPTEHRGHQNDGLEPTWCRKMLLINTLAGNISVTGCSTSRILVTLNCVIKGMEHSRRGPLEKHWSQRFQDSNGSDNGIVTRLSMNRAYLFSWVYPVCCPRPLLLCSYGPSWGRAKLFYLLSKTPHINSWPLRRRHPDKSM